MTTPKPAALRWAALALTVALSATLATGCGNDAPADAAPELSAQLARVDRAVATGDEARIRDRVEALVSATEAARDAGDLDDEQADRILAAADALLERLPAEEPDPEPTPTPSPSPTASPSPEDDEEHEEKPPKHEPKPKPPKDEHHKGKGHEDD
jgi:outer membrane biosynthesis protein TonB